MTTENQEYVFVPAGDQPAVQKLKRSLFKMIGFVAVCSAIATYFLKPNQEINALYVFLALSILIAIIVIPKRYIQNIRIDSNTRKLYASYLKMNGENGIITFDLDFTRITYKYNSTKASAYWRLTLTEDKSKIILSQSEVTSNKDQKNTFPAAQLDRIYEIINEIKNNTGSINAFFIVFSLTQYL